MDGGGAPVFDVPHSPTIAWILAAIEALGRGITAAQRQAFMGVAEVRSYSGRVRAHLLQAAADISVIEPMARHEEGAAMDEAEGRALADFDPAPFARFLAAHVNVYEHPVMNESPSDDELVDLRYYLERFLRRGGVSTEIRRRLAAQRGLAAAMADGRLLC